MSWLISVFTLGFLVLVHEFGHFVVARWSGVRVLRFSIGFGPRLLTWTRHGIEYTVSLLPLGGYVKMAGENEEQTKRSRAPDEFLAQPPGVRARIILAGPLVNWLVSIFTLWVVLVVGYPELLPTVGRLLDAMPAQAAGVQVGDRILAVNQHSLQRWDELTAIVNRSANHVLTFQIDRHGTRLDLPITPASKEITDPFGRHQVVGLIGVAPSGAFATYRLPPLKAVRETVARQREWAGQIGLSLWALFTGRLSAKESLTGPIGILYMTSEAARAGFGSLLYLMSLLSLSLAIFNVFPIPILDGGHLLFLCLEKFRGHPVSLRIQEKATQVSFAVLVTLVVFICVNDLSRFGFVNKVLTWWRPN